jgi:hypothetical protein
MTSGPPAEMLIVAKQIPTTGAPSNQATHTRSVVRFGGERRQACNAGAIRGGSRVANSVGTVFRNQEAAQTAWHLR